MMIFCALPLIILFLAGGKSFSSGHLWPILIVGFIGAYFWMMFRGHRSHDHEGASKNKDVGPGQINTAHDTRDENKAPETKSHGGYCY